MSTAAVDRARPASGLLGQNAHVQALLGALLLELHPPRHAGEERVVGADADVRARAHLGAALAHDYVSREHVLAPEALHAEPLGGRIAPVLGAAACLFVCHDLNPAKGWRAQPALMSVTLSSVKGCR